MNEELARFLEKDDNFAKARRFFKEIDTFKNELRRKVLASRERIGGRGWEYLCKPAEVERARTGSMIFSAMISSTPSFGNSIASTRLLTQTVGVLRYSSETNPSLLLKSKLEELKDFAEKDWNWI